jgi:hypothetical protein
MNPLHTILSYLSEIRFNITHIPTSGLRNVLFPSDFPTSIPHAFPLPLLVPHALPISCLLTSSLYLARRTSFEAPHYAVFSNSPLLSSAPFSQSVMSPCSSVNFDQVLYSNKTVRKIAVVLILSYQYTEYFMRYVAWVPLAMRILSESPRNFSLSFISWRF